ncbi:uncharacterized protein [Pituophis catenifer annectens]|uniref:uncharacterized protein n=1 Tax=Pituophis catenifer annectens TaxID=94852 RepID=UPI003994E031
MGQDEGNNKKVVDPSTSWPTARPILNDCHKICCTMFDEDLQDFRPILFGCRLSCCNVRDVIEREDVNDLTRSYLSRWEMTKRCSLSPVQGTGLSSVPVYSHNNSDPLMSNLSTDEESAEGRLERPQGYKHDKSLVFLRGISSEEESTEERGDCQCPTKTITNVPTADVNNGINEAVLKLTEYPVCLPEDVNKDITNVVNIAKVCECGRVGCICEVTTEFEDSDDDDDDDYYSSTSDEGYYSASEEW